MVYVAIIHEDVTCSNAMVNVHYCRPDNGPKRPSNYYWGLLCPRPTQAFTCESSICIAYQLMAFLLTPKCVCMYVLHGFYCVTVCLLSCCVLLYTVYMCTRTVTVVRLQCCSNACALQHHKILTPELLSVYINCQNHVPCPACRGLKLVM